VVVHEEAVVGIQRLVSRGRPATMRRLRLDRETWQATHTVPVTVVKLGPRLAMFALDAEQADAS
jgi:hypothetical protein